jgi:hypothetical protein
VGRDEHGDLAGEALDRVPFVDVAEGAAAAAARESR